MTEPTKPEFVQIFELITGIPFADAIDAAGDEEKQQELLRRIAENARNESRKGIFDGAE